MVFYLAKGQSSYPLSYVSSVLAALLCGSLYTWTAYSTHIAEIHDDSAISKSIGFGHIGLYFGCFLAGILFRKIEESISAIISILLTCPGYMFLALAFYEHTLYDQCEIDVRLISLAYLAIGLGNAFGYVSVLTTAVSNAKASRKAAEVGGIVACFGLSSFILTLVYTNFSSKNLPRFFLICAVAHAIVQINAALLNRRLRIPNAPLHSLPSSTVELLPTPSSLTPSSPLSSPSSPPSSPPLFDFTDFRTWEFFFIMMFFATLHSIGLFWINKSATYLEKTGTETLKPIHIMFISALGNLIGRIGISSLSDMIKSFISRPGILIISLSAMLLSILLPVLSFKGFLLLIAVGITTIAYGAAFSLVSTHLSDAFGTMRYSINYGIVSIPGSIISFVMSELVVEKIKGEPMPVFWSWVFVILTIGFPSGVMTLLYDRKRKMEIEEERQGEREGEGEKVEKKVMGLFSKKAYTIGVISYVALVAAAYVLFIYLPHKYHANKNSDQLDYDVVGKPDYLNENYI